MTYHLSDYPVLTRIAASKTAAHRLDDRAIRWLYSLVSETDLADMDDAERAFFTEITSARTPAYRDIYGEGAQ